MVENSIICSAAEQLIPEIEPPESRASVEAEGSPSRASRHFWDDDSLQTTTLPT